MTEVEAVKRHAAYGGTKYLIHCGREQMLRELIETERGRSQIALVSDREPKAL